MVVGLGSLPYRRVVGGHRLAGMVAAVLIAAGLVWVSPAGVGASGAAAVDYAALGDSYTAGPLIPDQSLSPLGCLRSNHNYPQDTAAALGLQLTDASCSGATTVDMAGAQTTAVGINPPQLSAVNSSDGVVTVGIGGNDIHFVQIIENCVALTPWGPTRVGWTCRSHYTSGDTDSIAATITALGGRLATVLQQVHSRAPAAKVFVVGYPAILPPTGDGCWPQMPLTYSDVGYLRAKEIQLNAQLASTAAAGGATYVDTYDAGASHSACTPEAIRWVEPLVPESLAAPVHPNARGEAAMAAVVETAMRAAGIR